MKIYISSDHGGYSLKSFLVKHFQEIGAEYEDLGPFEENPNDDYPDYAIPLAQKVVSEPKSVGILLCRNGVGVCIAANKVKGARAGISWNAFHAQSLKNDDNTNILCIPADYLDNETVLEIIGTWLSSEFGNVERHERRLKKLKDFENMGN